MGFTAKWVLIPKLRPFKAHKCLNPVSMIKQVPRDTHLTDEMAVPFRTLVYSEDVAFVAACGDENVIPSLLK